MNTLNGRFTMDHREQQNWDLAHGRLLAKISKNKKNHHISGKEDYVIDQCNQLLISLSRSWRSLQDLQKKHEQLLEEWETHERTLVEWKMFDHSINIPYTPPTWGLVKSSVFIHSLKDEYITRFNMISQMVDSLSTGNVQTRDEWKYLEAPLVSLNERDYDFTELRALFPGKEKDQNFHYYHPSGLFDIKVVHPNGWVSIFQPRDSGVRVKNLPNTPAFEIATFNAKRTGGFKKTITIDDRKTSKQEQQTGWYHTHEEVSFIPGKIYRISFLAWGGKKYPVYLKLSKDDNSGWYIPSGRLSDGETRLALYLEKSEQNVFKLDAYCLMQES